MTSPILQSHRLFSISPFSRIMFSIIAIAFIANLSALVDFFLHPEIGYFDDEHLIVGGVTAVFAAIVIESLVWYANHLESALSKIKSLESLLSICARCKKIREPESDPKLQESWTPFEAFISKRTSTTFSHGLCPKCAEEMHIEFFR